MRKLALIASALGLIAFSGIARADEKAEKSEKVETGTTLGGKPKTVKTKKIESSDGTVTESKTETVLPKSDERRDDSSAAPARRDDSNMNSDMSEKVEHKTTLTGKKQTKSTKKIHNPDGSETESTTTTETKK